MFRRPKKSSWVFCKHLWLFVMCQLNVVGFAAFISWTSNCSLCFKLQAYTHAHFGMQSMLVVYTVLPVCLGPIALLHHPIRCKRDTTGWGGDGLGGKRWGSSLVRWLIPNEMQIHSLCVCWVPLFFEFLPFPFAVFWFNAFSHFKCTFIFKLASQTPPYHCCRSALFGCTEYFAVA